MDCNRVNFVQMNVISDVFINLKQLFLLPGDLLFSIIDSYPKIQYFFEISCLSNHDVMIGFLSLLIWISFFLFLLFR
jgi:hypothetical protein